MWTEPIKKLLEIEQAGSETGDLQTNEMQTEMQAGMDVEMPLQASVRPKRSPVSESDGSKQPQDHPSPQPRVFDLSLFHDEQVEQPATSAQDASISKNPIVERNDGTAEANWPHSIGDLFIQAECIRTGKKTLGSAPPTSALDGVQLFHFPPEGDDFLQGLGLDNTAETSGVSNNRGELGSGADEPIKKSPLEIMEEISARMPLPKMPPGMDPRGKRHLYSISVFLSPPSSYSCRYVGLSESEWACKILRFKLQGVRCDSGGRCSL